MTQAEQQAYEVFLDEQYKEAQKWEYLARHLLVSLECVETCLMIDKPEAAQMEIDNARRHFETLTKDAA